MGFFDTLAENSFKQGLDGELIFYPNGAMGKGVVVPDEETRIKLHNFQKRTYKLVFFAVLPYSSIIGLGNPFSLTAFSPIILLVLYILYQQYSLTRGLKKHELRLGFGEAAQRGAKTLPNWYYWSFGILSILMITIGLTTPLLFKKTLYDVIFIVVGFCSFGLLGLGLSIKMYKLKNSAAEN